jgi:hypothetical protein
MTSHITFIGGGNMASAIIGGLLRQGMTAQQIDVVEPYAEARDKLQAQFGITALHGPGPALAKASLVVWAVKPQTFKEAALPVARFHTQAGAASERGSRHSQRQHRQLARYPAHRARHAQHAGAGRQGDDRAVRPARRDRGRPGVGEPGDDPHRAVPVGGGREPARRRHRPVGLRTGLCLLFPGGHDPGRCGHGPEPRAGPPPGGGHLRGRLGACRCLRRSARGAAPARDLQGRHDLCRHHVDGAGQPEKRVHARAACRQASGT